MKFNYQARTKTGEIQTGIIEASSREAAINLLQKYKFYVTFLEESKVQPFYLKRVKIFKRGVSGKEIALLTRQLSILFKSGVPLPESLLALAAQADNPGLKEKISKIEEEVEGGMAFSKALTYHPKLFSPFYISMVKSGEMVGKLSETLSALADHLEREYQLASKVRGAMVYPIFVLGVAFVIFLAMVFFILPSFAELLNETGQELPLITKVVMEAAEFLKKSGWILIIAIFVLIFFLQRYIKTKEGKGAFDKISLRVPLVKDLLKKIYLSRLAENLSTLISGGLPIAQALEVSGEIVGSSVYRDVILQTKEGVKRGETISAILGRYPEVISPFFVQMVIVGEKTGRLGESLLNIVDFYQKEVDRTLDNLTSLLEPIMIVFLGLMVAGLVASVLMPLYQTLGGL